MRYLNGNDFAALEANENFKKACSEFYGASNSYEYQLGRYRDLYAEHSKRYADNVLMFSSPGRIEVCGNHTDHNNGKVLCASISVDTIACVTPLEEDVITIASIGYPAVTVDINDLEINKAEYGSSEALVRGVCAYFKANGYKTGGFYATTTSDVFKGAGVSSSACFEVLVCEILNVIYNGGVMDAVTKAQASHLAESEYFGKPCGLMDQSAIALGGVSYIDFKDTSAPEIEKLDWKFDLDIALVNCGGDHCNLTDEYASIRLDMEAVARELGAEKLRFTDKAEFMKKLPKLQKKLDGRQLQRAMHYYNENARVEKCAAAIKEGKESLFKKYINESGLSSFTMLQNCYVPAEKAQRIPLALAVIDSVSNGNCAKRVHGGGFAGTAIAYGKAGVIKRVAKQLSKVFGKDNVYTINIRNSGTCLIEL